MSMSLVRRLAAWLLAMAVCVGVHAERNHGSTQRASGIAWHSLDEAPPIEGLPEGNFTAFPGGSGSVPLDCGGFSYKGPIRYLWYGGYGLTATMKRRTTEDKVVVKILANPAVPVNDMRYECEILRSLARAGVPNLLTCEAECSGEFAGRSAPVMVTAPFFEHGESMQGKLQAERFGTKDAAIAAMEGTLRTGFLMLAQGVCNADQDRNILYDLGSGRLLFIDLGLAVTISSDLARMSHSEAWAAWAPEAVDMGSQHWQEPMASIVAFLRILLEKAGSDLGLQRVASIWNEAWPQKLRSSRLFQAANGLFEQYQMLLASQEGNLILVQERLGRMYQRLRENGGSESEEVVREWDEEVLSTAINMARSQSKAELLKVLLANSEDETTALSLEDAVEVLDVKAATMAISGSPCPALDAAVETLSEALGEKQKSLESVEGILNLVLKEGANCPEGEFLNSDAVEEIFLVVFGRFRKDMDNEHLKNIFRALLPFTNRAKDELHTYILKTLRALLPGHKPWAAELLRVLPAGILEKTEVEQLALELGQEV